MKADRQTNKQTSRPTNKQADRHTNKQTGRQACRHTSSQPATQPASHPTSQQASQPANQPPNNPEPVCHINADSVNSRNTEHAQDPYEPSLPDHAPCVCAMRCGLYTLTTAVTRRDEMVSTFSSHDHTVTHKVAKKKDNGHRDCAYDMHSDRKLCIRHAHGQKPYRPYTRRCKNHTSHTIAAAKADYK
jgi:hypothetical protein